MEMEMAMREQEAALDIEQEYSNTLRVPSNAHFLSKKQRCEEEMEAFLQTHQQEFIPPVLRNMMMCRRRTCSEIELAMEGYFHASAEASEMCVELLRNIRSTQSNYQSMDRFLARMSDDGTPGPSTSAGDAPLALNLFCTARSNFRRIHDKYSSVFQSIRSSHRKVARKLKVAKAFKLFGLMAGPVAAGLLCPIAISKRMTLRTKTERCRKTGSLLRLRDQLDAAAKGTYVLSRDLDTVSHLVARLSNGIERENAMAVCCVERVEARTPVVEMVTELRRSCSSSRRLAEELEEHVCLCLATIHRARVLVIREISKSIV